MRKHRLFIGSDIFTKLPAMDPELPGAAFNEFWSLVNVKLSERLAVHKGSIVCLLYCDDKDQPEKIWSSWMPLPYCSLWVYHLAHVGNISDFMATPKESHWHYVHGSNQSKHWFKKANLYRTSWACDIDYMFDLEPENPLTPKPHGGLKKRLTAAASKFSPFSRNKPRQGPMALPGV